jgi:glycosyltransferase involved in cell wall biosynthesis
MRIAWVTPLGRGSAIADFSCHLTATLADFADVEIWTTDAGELLDTALPIVHFDSVSADRERLRGYDHVVYNIGNYLPFHGQIQALSQRQPGVVVLHDRVLHHLFVEIWRREPGGLGASYRAAMRADHGEEGERVARATVAGERAGPWESAEEAARYPLDVVALRGALGAVTHSRGHAASLRLRWLGPVCALDHPTYGDVLTAAAVSEVDPPGDRLQLTTVGHITRNRHADRLLATVAADAGLAQRVHVTIAGALDADPLYVAELRAAIAATPALSAELTGWLPDADLDGLLARTDVFANLRHPVTESGSGSLARELAYGRPILCFEEGCFGEMPAEAVARVASGDFAALGGELRSLVEDPVRRRRIGAAARRLAGERSEAAYARGLLDFLELTRASRPALALLDRLAAELGALDADPSLPVFETIASDFGRAFLV